MEDIINQSKKRKTLNDTVSLTQQDARKILQPLTKDQLIDILQTLITHDATALSAVRSIVDTDPSHRKHFIRGIGWDTTTTTLKSVFEQYGEVDEGLVIVDKATNKSKGYGFVTFKHVDGSVKALVEPSKKIDGRITVVMCKMAVDGKKGRAGGGMMSSRGPVPGIVNTDGRTSYSGYPDGPYMLPHQNPPPSGTRSGPGSYIAGTGYNRGDMLVRLPLRRSIINMPPAGPRGPHAGMYHGGHLDYNSEQGARRVVVDLVKSIDGYQVMCKMAVDGKKGRSSGGMTSPRGPLHSFPLPVSLSLPLF
nr:UBP1-associated protein 2C-like [Tanacetum cinerariifolium]